MIIYFEGLSCAGKTEVIKRFKDYFNKIDTMSLENVIYVSEMTDLPDDYNDKKIINKFEINNINCLLSDMRKSELSELNRDKLVLVDRGYASTLAYNYIDYKLKNNNDFILIKKWYKKNILSKKLRKPDLYIYIKTSATTSLERAKKIGRYNLKYAWYKKPEYAIEYYDNFFKHIENDVKLAVIDGERPIQDVFDDSLNAYLNYKNITNHAQKL